MPATAIEEFNRFLQVENIQSAPEFPANGALGKPLGLAPGEAVGFASATVVMGCVIGAFVGWWMGLALSGLIIAKLALLTNWRRNDEDAPLVMIEEEI